MLQRGKLAKPVRILSVRALTRDDLLRLKDDRVPPPRVKAFRATHHRLARLVAAGHRTEDILRITGYSYQRLFVLNKDPAFQELVAQFQAKVDEATLDERIENELVAAEIIARGLRTIDAHFDAADESGELIPLKTLAPVLGDLMDRFGYSKKTVQTNVNVDFARKVEHAMTIVGTGTVIDSRPLPAHSIDLEPMPQGDRVPPTTLPEAPKPVALAAGVRRR